MPVLEEKTETQQTERPKFCEQCTEDGEQVPLAGFIDGTPLCTMHLASLEGMRTLGSKIEDPGHKMARPDPIKALPRIIPDVTPELQSVVDVMGHTIRGILDGSYNARQANAVCNLASTALKAVELEWKIKRSKDISYVVKKLEE